MPIYKIYNFGYNIYNFCCSQRLSIVCFMFFFCTFATFYFANDLEKTRII